MRVTFYGSSNCYSGNASGAQQRGWSTRGLTRLHSPRRDSRVLRTRASLPLPSPPHPGHATARASLPLPVHPPHRAPGAPPAPPPTAVQLRRRLDDLKGPRAHAAAEGEAPAVGYALRKIRPELCSRRLGLVATSLRRHAQELFALPASRDARPHEMVNTPEPHARRSVSPAEKGRQPDPTLPLTHNMPTLFKTTASGSSPRNLSRLADGGAIPTIAKRPRLMTFTVTACAPASHNAAQPLSPSPLQTVRSASRVTPPLDTRAASNRTIGPCRQQLCRPNKTPNRETWTEPTTHSLDRASGHIDPARPRSTGLRV